MTRTTVHVPMDDGTFATLELPTSISADDAERISTAVSVYTEDTEEE